MVDGAARLLHSQVRRRTLQTTASLSVAEGENGGGGRGGVDFIGGSGVGPKAARASSYLDLLIRDIIFVATYTKVNLKSRFTLRN